MRKIFGLVAVAVSIFALPIAHAQQEQALNLTLLKTSIQTQNDDLTLTNNGVQAFPNLTVSCPAALKKGCTLAIDIASQVYYEGTGQNLDSATVTITGAKLPPVDPSASVDMDTIYYGGGEPTVAFSSRWMQRGVRSGHSVTVNIQMFGTGGATSRTETVSVFEN
jgi:hypothetical protein